MVSKLFSIIRLYIIMILSIIVASSLFIFIYWEVLLESGLSDTEVEKLIDEMMNLDSTLTFFIYFQFSFEVLALLLIRKMYMLRLELGNMWRSLDKRGVFLVIALLLIFISIDLVFGSRGSGISLFVVTMGLVESIPLIVGICLLGPIVEEIFYRGYLYVEIEEFVRSKMLTSILVSLLFVVPHMTQYGFYQLSFVFVFSMALNYVKQITNNLILCVMLHSLVNCYGLLSFYSGNL